MSSIEKTRVSVTLMPPYMKFLKKLINEGVYIDQPEALRAALRLLFISHGMHFLNLQAEPPQKDIDKKPKEKPVKAVLDIKEKKKTKKKKTPPPTPVGKQEYVDPCLHGLDFPFQDLEICDNCKNYRPTFKPIRCKWPWKKIGWEEEAEE